LRLHGIFGRAEEALDPEMLFDPFEEQFDLPAALVERAREMRRCCMERGRLALSCRRA
jgi:hypothetical protein